MSVSMRVCDCVRECVCECVSVSASVSVSVCASVRTRGRVIRAAGRRGCWGGVWGGEAELAKAAMTMAGPTEGGPGQRAAAERGRCRRPARPRALSGSRSVRGAAGTGRSHRVASPRGPTVAVTAAPAAPGEGGPLAVAAAERELRSRGRVAFRWEEVEVRRSRDWGWPRRSGRAVRAAPCRGRGAMDAK